MAFTLDLDRIPNKGQQTKSVTPQEKPLPEAGTKPAFTLDINKIPNKGNIETPTDQNVKQPFSLDVSKILDTNKQTPKTPSIKKLDSRKMLDTAYNFAKKSAYGGIPAVVANSNIVQTIAKEQQPAMKLLATAPDVALGLRKEATPEEIAKTDMSWYEILKVDRPENYLKFEKTPTSSQWYAKFADEFALNLADELLTYGTKPEALLLTYLAYEKALPLVAKKASKYIMQKSPKLYEFLVKKREIALPDGISKKIQSMSQEAKYRLKKLMGIKQETGLSLYDINKGIKEGRLNEVEALRKYPRAFEARRKMEMESVGKTYNNITPEPPVQPVTPAQSFNDTAFQQTAEKAGVKYKGRTAGFKKKDGTDREGIVNFDPPATTPGEATTTLALKESEFTPENIQKKVDEYNKKVTDTAPAEQKENNQEIVSFAGAQVTKKDLTDAIETYAVKGTGFTPEAGTTRGVDNLIRPQSGKKKWEDMTDIERVTEFEEEFKKDIEVARGEVEKGKEVEYVLNRALDPLDPMNGMYKILLKKMGATIDGGKIKLPENLQQQVMPKKVEQPNPVSADVSPEAKTTQSDKQPIDVKTKETFVKEYAELLGQPPKKFHEDFVNAIINKDATYSGIKMLTYAKGQNEVSKKMFTKITGIKLPGTATGNKEVIDAWLSGKDMPIYNKFKIRVGDKLQSVTGEEVKIGEFDAFVAKEKRGYYVSEKETGLSMTSGHYATKEEAIKMAVDRIEKVGSEKVNQAIAQAKEKWGVANITERKVDKTKVQAEKVDKEVKKSDTDITKKEGDPDGLSNDRKEKAERQDPKTGESSVSERSERNIGRSDNEQPANSDKPARSERPGRTNYELTEADGIGQGTAGQKIENNLKAIEIVKKIQSENRLATAEEKKDLVKYTGWGGLSQIFSTKWQAQAKRLKELTTPQEFAAARASTINAHYTSPEVVQAMWTMVKNLGFKGGNVLEPAAGVGNFIGLGPQSGVKYHAIELDTITGSILKNIYQQSIVNIKGFENVDYPKGKFDLIISNVPFSSYKPYDARYKELGIPGKLSLHDYFFAKSIILTKDNGIVAFITSRFTLDKQSPEFRKWMADRTDLIAAYRLPSNAFKENAGTEVVTDIIILKKRPENVAPSGPAWTDVKQSTIGEDTVVFNEYFHNNPTNVLGQLGMGKGLYAEKELTVIATGNVSEQLNKLAASLSPIENISESALTADEETKAHDIESIPDSSEIKNNAYIVQKGRVYQKQGEELIKTEFTGPDAQRVIQMIEVRDAYRKALHEQLINANDNNLKPLLSDLQKKYTAFVKKFGSLNSTKNSSIFVEDPDAPLLLSLEKETKTADGKKLYVKTEAFTKRTIKHHKVPDKAENATDGLRISLSEKGELDTAFIAKLTNKKEADVIADLEKSGEIFKDPELNKHVTRDEYLSGNVKVKFKEASKAGLIDNIKALTDVIPVDLKFDEISVRIGTPFVEPEDYKAFMSHLFDQKINSQMVVSKTSDGVWRFKYYGYSPNNTKKWGISQYRGDELLEAIANDRPIKVFDTVRTGNGDSISVLNEEKSILAEQKAEELKIEFQNWFWKDEARRTKYVNLYNEKYNNTVSRKFNGDHLVLPGLSNVYSLRPNQKNAIWRIVTNKAVMVAHEVGAGKTLSLIAGAMEAKRLGVINKPMIVVPKNTLPQWQREWMSAYPGARILVADERNFTAKKRKQFLARITTGNWDGIIIADSSYSRIGVSMETYEKYVTDKVSQLRDEKARLVEAGAKISVKDIERSIKSLEAKLAEKLKQTDKDNVVDFEELGVDALFVDEADMFKNLAYTTTKQGIKGLGSPSGSQKAEDMLLKIRNLQSKKAYKVVFATGTPISNTMAEVYSMMQYLQPEELEALGAKSFDDWAALFGEVKHDLEVDVTGGRYKTVSRFSKFINIPELMSVVRKVWDIQTASMLEEAGILVKGKNLPFVKGGRPQMVMGEARTEMREYIKSLIERADSLKGKRVEKGGDNMLVILSDGIKASLDMRLIDATLPSDPESKIEKAIDLISDIYKRTIKTKGTQLVFIDKPSPEDKVHTWNPYNYMRDELVKRGGVKPEEIEFIHDHDTSVKKAALYEKVNSGEVRILFGSTEKMGAGTNVQERLYALHHVSVPSRMRPRDITQRNGRIVRSGNTNKEVEIYMYSTKGSLDTFIWQMLESKAKSINQIMSYKDGIREFSEDIDEYAILKAASSDNPLIKEKVELDKEVKKLQALQKAQMNEIFEAEKSVKSIPKEIESTKVSISEVEKDIKNTPVKTDKETFDITINGTKYTDRESAHIEMIKLESAIAKRHRKEIGTYKGYTLEIDKTSMLDTTKLNVVSPSGMIYEKTLSSSVSGTFTAIDNAIYNDPKQRIEVYNQRIDRLEKEMAQATERLKKQIDTTTLKEKSTRLAEVNRILKEANESTLSKEDKTRKDLEEDDIDIEGPEGQIGMSIKIVQQDTYEPTESLTGKKPEYTGNKGWDKDWLAPMKAMHDWLFTFGKQKRIDPALYDELIKAYYTLSSRVENSIIEAKNFFGKNLTSTDRAELTFAREEKSYKIRPELQKESDAFNKIMDKIEEVLKESGVFQMGFIESKKAALLDSKAQLEMAIESLEASQKFITDDQLMARIDRQINTRKTKLDKVNKDLEQLEDLNFVTHRSVAKAVMNRKFTESGDREKYLASVRRISYKYRQRKGITPLRILYDEKLLTKHDVDAFNILAMQLSEARFRMTMKGLFDYFKKREMLLHKNTKNVPAFYHRISPIVTGIVAGEYNDYYIHPLALQALQEIKDLMTSKGGPVRAVYSIIKTGQFVKPSIIWVYDVLQAAYGGALGVKTPIYMAKAIKAVYTESVEYRVANQSGAFQQMYLPVVGGKTETEMIKLAARQTLKDMPQVVKIMEKIFDMTITKDQGLRYLMLPYRILSKFTWDGDKVLRMSSFFAFKDMGYSDAEAGKLAGNIHGAYSDIAKKPRDLFSYIFFVHSFRILMPKLMTEILGEPFKLAHEQFIKGNKQKGRDWKRSIKAFVSLILIPYLYDKYLTDVKGYERKVPLWKYQKPLDEDFDVVLNVNSIVSQPFKWVSRLMKYQPNDQLPRFVQGFKAWWKWEQHPLYRIIGDIAENKRSLGGGKVYNPNQNQTQIAKDMIGYTIRESFRMIETFAPEDDEHLRNRYNIPQAKQKELIDQNFDVFEKVMNKLFGYAYVTRNDKYWKAYAKGRIALEYRNRLYRSQGALHTARISEWYKRAIKYVDEH